MHNVLRVSIFFPVLRREILELVVGKMLKLDVSAQPMGVGMEVGRMLRLLAGYPSSLASLIVNLFCWP